MILAVCHGNINRSAAVGVILATQGVPVASAGFVNPGRRMAKKMREALGGYDFIDQSKIEAHRSQLVTEQLCQKANLILYMDSGNLRRLLEKFPEHQNKFQCLGDYHEPTLKSIADPNYMSAVSLEFKVVVEQLVRASLIVVTLYNKKQI